MTPWYRVATAQCPLRVEHAEWNDPVLLIRGPSWHLQTMSPWRITLDGRLVMSWEDTDAPALIQRLVGRSVIKCVPLSPTALGDPRFELDDGHAIELFATHGLEPWVFGLPSSSTIVASPSDNDWIRRQSPGE